MGRMYHVHEKQEMYVKFFVKRPQEKRPYRRGSDNRLCTRRTL